MTAAPNASPGTADIDFDYGPGTFNFLVPAAGLSNLASYRSTLKMSFSGTEGGQPSQWSQSYEMTTTRDPDARQLTFTAGSDDGQGAAVPVYRAQMNGLSFERRGDASCTNHATFAADSLAARWEPAHFLSGITGAVESGTETVNNVPATRYEFDQRAFGSAPESTSAGQIWVASDGGYIVRYLLTTSGADEYFGEGGAGELTVDYQLTDVNAASPIALPTECVEGVTDGVAAPLMDDATDVVRVPGLDSYVTTAKPVQVFDFYSDKLSALGWKSVVEPTTGGTTSVETFQRDGKQLSVIVGETDAGTTVRLIFDSVLES